MESELAYCRVVGICVSGSTLREVRRLQDRSMNERTDGWTRRISEWLNECALRSQHVSEGRGGETHPSRTHYCMLPPSTSAGEGEGEGQIGTHTDARSPLTLVCCPKATER